MYLCFILVLFKVAAAVVLVEFEKVGNISFQPEELLKIKTGSMHTVRWFTDLKNGHHIRYHAENERVSSVRNITAVYFGTESDNITAGGTFDVVANFLGYNTINFTLYDFNNKTLATGRLKTSVILSYQKINRIFTASITVLVFISYLNMGAAMNFEVIKGIAKKPIGPLIGILCQYGLMPVFSFVLGKFFFEDNTLRWLGMFLDGTSPGGGASNTWTYLLDGSLDLSVIMTFFSTICAFGAVPLWVLTLGPQITADDTEFFIPFKKIAFLTITFAVPCVIGLLLRRFLPKIADFLKKRVLPCVAIFNICYISSFGIYTHRYIFNDADRKVLLAAFLLPFAGYVAGFTIALLAKRSKIDIIAIAIETGVQNANIPTIILKAVLEAPSSDLAVVIPSFIFLMTPLPLFCIYVVKKVIQLVQFLSSLRHKFEVETKSDETMKENYDNRKGSCVELIEVDNKAVKRVP